MRVFLIAVLIIWTTVAEVKADMDEKLIGTWTFERTTTKYTTVTGTLIFKKNGQLIVDTKLRADYPGLRSYKFKAIIDTKDGKLEGELNAPIHESPHYLIYEGKLYLSRQLIKKPKDSFEIPDHECNFTFILEKKIEP